jgi:Mg2+/citrate symporter
MPTGIACLVVFLSMALLMYTRRLSALLALPIMAIIIAGISGMPATDIVSDVAGKGALKLHGTYTTTMFGAMLAELVNKQGIARALIRWVAEFAGDNPFLLSIMLTIVTALLFSTLGGLGAVIMVGTIVLPVMLSLGISSITAGALYLFGISLGGMFNIASWQLYIDVLKIEQEQIISFVLPFASIISVIILLFLSIELGIRKNLPYVLLSLILGGGLFAYLTSASQAHRQAPATLNGDSVTVTAGILGVMALYAIYRQSKKITANPPLAMVSPLVPLILVLFFHWDFIPAFMAGLAFCVFATWKKDSVNVLTRSIIDGITQVIPAVVLMIGIGMLIAAVSHASVTGAVAPLLTQIIPTKAGWYILTFTALAPFALYRGPLSLWGMGSGLVALVQKATTLSGPAIMGMLLSVGQVQGICDPTNTANIWIATYLGTDTQVLLRKTIPYAWLAAVSGLSLAACLGYVPW